MENLKKSFFLLAYFFFASDLALNAQELRGYKDYTGIFLGNFNIIITAPHGGLLQPNDIQTRTEKALGDTNTFNFAIEFRNQLSSIFKSNGFTNNVPYLVYNKLHR